MTEFPLISNIPNLENFFPWLVATLKDFGNHLSTQTCLDSYLEN